MRVNMPNNFEVELVFQNQYEECFILGALAFSEYFFDFAIEKNCVKVFVDLDYVDEFRAFVDKLEEEMAQVAERFIDYTI